MGGFQGSDKFPGLAAYSTAKGALAILSECLSTEFSSDGIAVNCLCLGAVQTAMLEEAFPGYEAPVKPNEMGSYISKFVLEGHKFMNGKIIPVSLNNPE
jgi:NAD(P)-dependent dehydrogenase (short-subunit alcohol dehydrogenase family)